ncbi:hypothetical protein AMI01nite_15970 [Aneurinibacillus migulanus]|nr:hypothetical protein AMI01nite_15970 [Aneurinibacillus migulanus]
MLKAGVQFAAEYPLREVKLNYSKLERLSTVKKNAYDCTLLSAIDERVVINRSQGGTAGKPVPCCGGGFFVCFFNL